MSSTRQRDAREGVIQINVRVPKDRASELKTLAKDWLRQYRATLNPGKEERS